MLALRRLLAFVAAAALLVPLAAGLSGCGKKGKSDASGATLTGKKGGGAAPTSASPPGSDKAPVRKAK